MAKIHGLNAIGWSLARSWRSAAMNTSWEMSSARPWSPTLLWMNA